MSSSNYSYSSSSFTSSTSFSGGQGTGQAYQSTTHSDPSGTRVQTTSQNLGEPPVQETRHYDADGRQVLDGGRTLGQGSERGRIEDETDESKNDRTYRERKEDEYPKREGGA
jgi:hypothetical protein